MLPLGRDTLVTRYFNTGIHPVLLLQKLKREMHTLEIATFNFKIARHLSPHGKTHRIIVLEKLVGLDILSDLYSTFKLNAFGFEQIETTVNHTLIELEVRDAETQKSSRCLIFLIYRNGMPATVQLVGTCKSGRA